MKIYCPNCGKGIEYATTKPNFCMSCGEAVSAQAVTKQKTVPKMAVKAEPEEEEQVEEDEESSIASVDTVPDISQLDFDLSIQSQKQRIGDIIGSPTRKNSDDGFVRESSPAQDSKTFLENFKKEAGQLRPNK